MRNISADAIRDFLGAVGMIAVFIGVVGLSTAFVDTPTEVAALQQPAVTAVAWQTQ